MKDEFIRNRVTVAQNNILRKISDNQIDNMNFLPVKDREKLLLLLGNQLENSKYDDEKIDYSNFYKKQMCDILNIEKIFTEYNEYNIELKKKKNAGEQ